MIDRTPKPCHHPNVTHEHGTHRTYIADGCRCWPCVAAYTAKSRRQHERVRLGIQTLIDAEPSRQHVKELRAAGHSIATIIRLTGVSNGTIQELVYGNRQRVIPSVEKRILAVPVVPQNVDTAPPFGPVPSIGARRRVHALCALGWSLNRQAAKAGLSKRTLRELAWRDACTAATYQAIADLYDQLWDQIPPANTKQEKIVLTRVTGWARSNGWPPPLAWDDETIDDPNARPDTTGMPQVSRDHPRHQQILALHGQGLSDRKIAAAIGVTGDAVRYWRMRIGLTPNTPGRSIPLGDEPDDRYLAGAR